MSPTITQRHSLHISSIDAYAERFGRMSVLIDWLSNEVVHGEPGVYHEVLIRAVAFLHDEMLEGEAEQKEIGSKLSDLDEQEASHDPR